jgi:hypothetical protein
MFIYDDLKSVSAKSGYTLYMALIIVVTGVGAPVGDGVAQEAIQTPDIQTPDMQTIDMQTPDMQGFDATEINPTEIKPTEINATEINPTDINATEIKPTEITPTEITPLQDDFFVKKVDPSIVEEAAVPDAPASAAAAGPNMGPAILIGGAAAAAGLAGIALSGLSTTTGVDCGPAPLGGSGNAWFYNEYAPWCECMDGTPIISTGTCVQ